MTIDVNTILKEALESGFQIEPKAFEFIKELEDRNVDVRKIVQIIINKKLNEKSGCNITEKDLENELPPSVKEGFKASAEQEEQIESQFKVLKTVNEKISQVEGKEGFEGLFKSRYNRLLKIVSSRPDYYKIEKISSLKTGKREGRRKVCGLVMRKKMRRNNVVLSLDDDTGMLEVMAGDKNIVEDVKQLLLDSLVTVDIEFSKSGMAIAKSVSLPDIPEHIPTVSSKRVYAVFTSDLHVGSRSFLEEDFKLFISWLKQRERDKDIVSRIKYIVIAGDAVDGVGVYPKQEADLKEPDVQRQYNVLSELLRQIPKSIDIFIVPGNHDPVRQALPQPSISQEYAKEVYNISNVIMLGNPSYISLHGVRVLVYHGRSLDDVIATTPGFTFTRPAVAMKALLRARHLVPVYGERSEVAPSMEDDLVIEDIPDIFHAGHIHTLDSEKYKGTIILNSGSWQSQTAFQAKMGIIPTPSVVPIVDLSSLEVFTRDFKATVKE